MNHEADYALNENVIKRPARPTYWLTRFMILRLLGLVYAIAFRVAIDQLIPIRRGWC